MRYGPGPAAGSVALFLLVLFLLATPFTDWWMEARPPWYVPYLGWAVVIALGGWLIERGTGRDL
ncbi:hypothetical protein [Halorhodospira halophila]|uniref:hypothetical protein n=1 Tax=Halorhodospira halophila TaxID=1053 RepID=UPI00059F8033|nr:hypothetical protein [Halorhodospira halophila]MBK1728337.1 hypothetical protein [Halorhodospira halophila]